MQVYLQEGGGDLPVFSTDTTTVDSLDTVLEFLIGPPDVFDRMLPVLQTGVDSSDPAIWATHVLRDRFDQHPIPDLLFPVCVEDDTVPPATAKALAHGLNIPHLKPVLDPVPMLEVQRSPSRKLTEWVPPVPISSLIESHKMMPSYHQITTTFPVVPKQYGCSSTFWKTHLLGETEIRDPYAELGTPALE